MVGVQSMRNIYCKQFPSNFCLFPSAIDAPGADFAASVLSAPGHWLGPVWGAQEDVKRWISFSCFSCLGGFNQSSFCCRLSLVLLGSGKYLTTTLFQVYSVLWCGMLKVGFFTNSIILLSFGFSMPLARRVSQPESGTVKSMAWTEKVDLGDLQWSGIKLSHELFQVIKSVGSTISALKVPALRLAALGSPPRGNCLGGSDAPLFQPRERLSWMAEWIWFEDFGCRFTSLIRFSYDSQCVTTGPVEFLRRN